MIDDDAYDDDDGDDDGDDDDGDDESLAIAPVMVTHPIWQTNIISTIKYMH